MQQYFRYTTCNDYDFKNKQLTSNITSLTDTPKVNVHKLTPILKQEYIIEGFKYVRMKFRKRGHFYQFNRKEPGHQKLPLKRAHVEEKQDCLVTLLASDQKASDWIRTILMIPVPNKMMLYSWLAVLISLTEFNRSGNLFN
jgi:hypothetical protein